MIKAVIFDCFGVLLPAGDQKDPELMAWVAELRSQGYKTAVLSNMELSSLLRRFSEDELRQSFDAWVLSGEVNMVKPMPGIYELTARQLGVEPSDCVFFDDRGDCVDGALAVGMQAFVYAGYDGAREAFEQTIRAEQADSVDSEPGNPKSAEHH